MRLTYLDLYLLADEYFDMHEIQFSSIPDYGLKITRFGTVVELTKKTSNGYKSICRFVFSKELNKEKEVVGKYREYIYFVTIYPYSRIGVPDNKFSYEMDADTSIGKPNTSERIVACKPSSAFIGPFGKEVSEVILKMLKSDELPTPMAEGS